MDISRLRRFPGRRINSSEPEPAIRAELFSVERLEQHAESLARAQIVAPSRRAARLLAPRLYENSTVLEEAYRKIVRATRAQQAITPAAEWLLDNFHVIDEQVREIKQDLPPRFYRRLPKLAEGPLKGYPRVFGVAWAIVAHSDSAFDIEKLTRFVEAYQRVQPLTIGELWAIAITLRITLVENLRRLAEAIVVRLSASRAADELADRILGTADRDPESAAAILRSLEQVQWSTAFAVQLSQRLRDRDPTTTPVLRWLNERLGMEGTTTDQIVREEFQFQSAMNVTVRNVITSMRLVSMINWSEFVESVSPIDSILRGASDFAAMDFPTRDLYRREIEELARASGRDESDVARRVIAATKRSNAAPRERDPGYVLISNGRVAFERQLGCRIPFRTILFRLNTALGVTSYVGMIALVTAIVLAAALFFVAHAGIGGWVLVALGIVGMVPASDVSIAVVNRAITHMVGAAFLPGLELRDGVPQELRTIVVVPTLLTAQSEASSQIERLEVHYLSNADESLSFALLSDWGDAPSEHAPGDDLLLAAAVQGIAELNARYPRAGGEPRFFLLHRRRVWNEGERKWIGWERKRGKLHELDRLLRGTTDTNFLPINGRAPSLPSGIRYVITLDADTRMPIGVARRLVGKMAHPLNRPRFDPRAGLVMEGHAVLQPRVTPSLPIGSEGSLFQRVFSGPNGLDPYALVVSDVYQDLFEEGTYSGKGIYDVDAFEAALNGKIPDSTVLSHDLLEGILARAGLVSDIEFVEEFPSRYSVAAARQHRWVRGDWQLLPWIFGRGRKAHSASPNTTIPLMGRWKMLDNLRRSLSAPAALLAMLMAWLILPFGAAAIWTLYIILTIVLPPLLPTIAAILPRSPGIPLRTHLRSLGGDFTRAMLQSAFLLTFLAHQAWLMVDAVARTLFRLFIHRRRLLEWVTTSQTNDDSQFDPRSLIAQIGASAAFAAVAGFAMVVDGHHTWPIAAPFAALWVLSPLAARWASLPPPESGHLVITPDDATALRMIARRTWRFFEQFVTPEDNALPPDNFQEDPKPVIAHRTSPTNMGLYLLSVIAARDFGWLGTIDAVERLEATLTTMQKLERYRGHLFNWYDTRDLRALEPKYVSTVDSGNLAGHLIALGNACRAIASQPIANSHWQQGLSDNLVLLRKSLRTSFGDRQSRRLAPPELSAAVDRFAGLLGEPSGGAAETPQHIKKLAQEIDAICEQALSIESANPGGGDSEVVVWADALRACVCSHRRDFDGLMPQVDLGDGNSAAAVRSAMQRLEALADLATSMSAGMEFGFLFDSGRQLLSIGYRESDGSLDSNFYDLLASEARLASFIAIAKGDVPAKHWFRLGRTLTPIDSGSGLISWSGSMFEYLMPSLVMRAPSGSLLEQTNRLVVRRQEEYGTALGVPWGISESAYNARDMEHNYQYSSFGVPDLGYKRGLVENTVVAPYASGLAAMVDPAAVVRNFNRMADIGAQGAYGWYEALDYTRVRLPEGAKFAVIRAYMAHHQAMTIVGIANAVDDGAMRAYFHEEPIVQAAELLLQERVPREVAIARPPPEQMLEAGAIASRTPEVHRRYTSAHSRVPRTHILSNGRYSTMITAAGSGYSRWGDIALTRWREDVTCDGWGAYVFLRDVHNGEFFSAGYQPSVVEPDGYEVTFFEDRAEIIRRDSTLTITLDVTVSPEDDAEVRRVSITNHGIRTREIEVTSYAEIALARQADDIAHPAFSKLFVETEFEPNLGAILATRRRKSDGDPLVWAAHLAVVEGESSGDVQFETDRARFLGRGRTIRSPAAIVDGWPLSNTSGAVLDAIFSLRRRVRIPRGVTARVAFWTVAASSRDDVLNLADKHRDPMAFERATTLAWTQAQMQLRHLGIGTSEAHVFQRLANHVLYSDPTLRPSSAAIANGLRKASALWPHGISGDLPIVLVRISDEEDLELVRQLLDAHEYWRLKQLNVDLVILNERAASYVQDLQTALDALVRMNQSMPKLASEDVRGNVFVLRADLISADVRDCLHACARAILTGSAGSLAEQINRARDLKPAVAPPARRAPGPTEPEIPLPRPEMQFWNGLGGFALDGREYVTILEGSTRTPAPWVNIIANPDFGFQVSTDGSGFTWSLNSQQNQLTPWSNDAVGDAPGEAIYVRDEESGEVWTPTALPIREKNSSYLVRHGQGYSRFGHDSHGISLELLQYVPVGDPIKISRLKITNHSGRPRRLSVTTYVDWALGTSRSITAPFIVTEIDPETGAIFARNPWNDQFGERVAFADLNDQQKSWTADRMEFIGRDGALDRPLALSSAAPLSGRAGAGLDACAALQTLIAVAAVGTTEVVFFLGETQTKAEAQALLAQYRRSDLDAVLTEVTAQWDSVLGVVQVKTPDDALDILLNRWLLYQTLACRVWARAGFYQASGAYGFRDQLQDVMALCVSRPDLARAHLLRAAARQFIEGDVQHWWLAESGRGIRTRISDDRCWLAYAVAHYVNVTGDRSVLDETVPFLEAPALHEGERDRFFQPAVSDKHASLFEHCALALDRSLVTGAHSLPLMGTGDWNDGMDRVGEGGKGERVWLAWFLFSTLTAFAPLADAHDNAERAAEWRQFAATLKDSIERQAWDGDWYRRAYFDDGSPLGSVANNECRIDSIAQSWAVISRAGQPARAARAMAALDKYLVRRDEQLLLLLAPPFDNPANDPGYIKGYPPGIRENGGQYTHAALWAAMAWAMLGEGDRTGEILSMLNPVNHAGDPPGVHRYRVEPYVACADIYAMPPHVGRGGWTWYTGSAAWMYRVGLERLLGFRLNGGNLTLDPCIPRTWPGFEIAFRYRSSRYAIVVENPLGVCRGILATKIDGEVMTGNRNRPIPLKDDNADHRVQIILG